MDLKKLIIDRKEKLSPVRGATEWSLTVVGWAVWFFFCRPLFVVLLWFLGLKMLYTHMILLEGLHSLLRFFLSYTTVIVGIVFGVRFWNYYNWKRFRRKNQRRISRVVEPNDLDRIFKMLPGSIEHIQNLKEVRVDFRSDNRLRVSDGTQEIPRAIRGERGKGGASPKVA